MNHKTIVKLSNIVATVSIILLIYWVFIFVSVEVFGFKIFRENISQTFAMSILGILALMGGSLMLNIMFNLTRIAEKHNKDDITKAKNISKNLAIVFLLSFPLIFGLLYSGDYFTSKKKESMLIQSAKSVIENNPVRANDLANYEFSKDWIIKTSKNLELLEKTDKNFPGVYVIVKDSIDNTDVFLHFRTYLSNFDEQENEMQPEKKDYVLRTTKAEREYLQKVFDEGFTEIRFSASDGNYELYYPYFKNGKKVVLYFSDHQNYGKLGS